VKHNSLGQGVLLGAGLDSRCFRLDFLKGVNVFEVDFPSIIDYKNSILNPYPSFANRKTISADLSSPNWIESLQQSGFDKNVPSFWVLEGLLPYFKKEDAMSLLSQVVSLSSPGSHFMLEVLRLDEPNQADEKQEERKLMFQRSLQVLEEINSPHQWRETEEELRLVLSKCGLKNIHIGQIHQLSVSGEKEEIKIKYRKLLENGPFFLISFVQLNFESKSWMAD